MICRIISAGKASGERFTEVGSPSARNMRTLKLISPWKDSCKIKRDNFPNHPYCLLRRRRNKFVLQQLTPVIKPPLAEKRRKVCIDFAQEFTSRRAFFWNLGFLLTNFTMSLPKRTKKVICGKDFPERLVSPVQKVSHSSKLLVWAEIKHRQPCRWTFIEGPMNNAKLFSLMTNVFPEFNERMSSVKAILFRDNTPRHVSREVSK